MAEKSSFFNSYAGDRVYNAALFAEYFASFLTNGIFNGGAALKVAHIQDSMDIEVLPGKAWINGYYYHLEDAPKRMTLEPAHLTLARIDRVVLRLNLNESIRRISAEIKKGADSSSPVAPELQRDNAVWELGLADVRINANVKKIEASNITDLRLNNDLCGLVNSLIQADTTTIFNQFQAWYTEKTGEYELQWDSFVDDWNAWFSESDTGVRKIFNDFKNDYTAWYQSIKTQIFDAKYFDFDNWTYRAGQTKKVVFNPNGSITETLIQALNNDVVATKTIVFNSATMITETLNITEDNLTITKTTTFNADGSIDEVIE